jgi:hypothetical protein
MLNTQVRESTIRHHSFRGKTKVTREPRKSTGDWDIREQHHPAGEEGHQRFPEGSSVITGEKSSTYWRTRHNNSCWKSEILRSNQISDEDR